MFKSPNKVINFCRIFDILSSVNSETIPLLGYFPFTSFTVSSDRETDTDNNRKLLFYVGRVALHWGWRGKMGRWSQKAGTWCDRGSWWSVRRTRNASHPSTTSNAGSSWRGATSSTTTAMERYVSELFFPFFSCNFETVTFYPLPSCPVYFSIIAPLMAALYCRPKKKRRKKKTFCSINDPKRGFSL